MKTECKFNLAIHLDDCCSKAPPEQWTTTLSCAVPQDRDSFCATQKEILSEIQVGILRFLLENFCKSLPHRIEAVRIDLEVLQLPELSIESYSMINQQTAFTEENAITRLIEARPDLEKWVGEALLAVILPLLNGGSAS